MHSAVVAKLIKLFNKKTFDYLWTLFNDQKLYFSNKTKPRAKHVFEI